MILMHDMLNEDGMAYSMCSECGNRIDTRADARWLDNPEGWDAIICAGCACAHAPDTVTKIEPHPQIATLIETDERLIILGDEMNRLKKTKRKAIMEILKSEGYEVGMKIYQRSKPYIVTGSSVNGMSRESVKITMYPVKKDGTASKQNKDEMEWHCFIKLWRLQRSDQDAYVKRCEEKDAADRERHRKTKITDDQL